MLRAYKEGRRALLLAFVEEGFEAGVAGAADGEACAVGENREAAVLAVGLGAGDALEVHDVGAVDTHETVWVKARFQSGDGLLLEMLFAKACKSNVIILSFRIVEFGDRNQSDLGAVFYHQAFEEL